MQVKLKNLGKKNIKLLILIFGLIVLVVSTSYAVFSIRHENSNNQVISAGELELTYNSCSTMTTEMVPMSNEDGMAQTGCNVTVENTGSLDALYKVLIYNNSSGSNLLSHDNLYISIDNSTPVLLSTITKLENTEKYNLKEDILLVDNTRTHNIKIWIKEDATTDIIGKSINLIVDIEAEVAPEPNYLASEPMSPPVETSIFWGGPIGRDLVETISFTTTNEVPTGAVGSWDAGETKNGGVMAWYTDTDANGKYEVTVGTQGGVYTPENSYSLFRDFRNLSVLNLTNLNTSRTINMAGMFQSAGYNNSTFILDLGDSFDTSNVTLMYQMFSYIGYQTINMNIYLGNKFDTSRVTNMSNMFSNAGYNSSTFTLNLGQKFDMKEVTDISTMFYSMGRMATGVIIDLRDIDFLATNTTHAFYTVNASHKIYASSSNIAFISDANKGFTGTIINCTTSPASCP